ncbi:23S rRNA pseudouridine2604 synthase [Pontibacter aydingkolensis]|uniref:Pseudouridine synthase n=1 Tax=Pontibacter aydingkolensis TaxID=1911536 RepID=A0ABS7CZM4_9BACT|nr:pseudouridine synthase [Pontibacter aydingkolensis]MBW7469262.1 pseudouridine synthase [Pontibacter aydingkolensis]
MEPKRLNKFISDTGFCSRREADRLIEEGRVTVNGREPDAGTKVTPKDKVRIDDQMLRVREEAPTFLVLNKPSGMSATADMEVRDNVVRAINHPASLLPVGKLDRDDEGVLILSNDSDFVRKLSKADSKLEKELVVTVNKPFTSEFISKLSEACASFEDGNPKKAVVNKESTTRFRIILEPGMNHSIKKTCEALGYNVTFLQRVRIQSITLIKLQKGHWRTLTAQEIDSLKQIAASKPEKVGAKSKSDSRSSSSKSTFGKDKPSADKGAYQRPGKSGASEFNSPGKRIGKSRPPKTESSGPKGVKGGAKPAGRPGPDKGGFKGGAKKGGPSRGGSSSRSR